MNAPMPLFDHVFKTGESKISSSVVKKRAIRSQPVSPSRSTDPQTSVEAANANQDSRAKLRLRVFDYLKSVGERGANDYEISEALSSPTCKVLRTSAGKRRGELVDLGLAEYAGFSRPTDTGSSARVWRVK
jgi:hypothetical protein